MSLYRYLLGLLLGAIAGVLALRELGIFPGVQPLIQTLETERYLHSLVVLAALMLAGIGGAAWISLRGFSSAYERRIADLLEVNRIKNDLLSSAAHEIRTPITGMMRGLKSILDSKNSPETFNKWPLLEQIYAALYTLRDTANGFLNLAQLENNSLEIVLHPIPLSDLEKNIKEIIAEYKIRAEMMSIMIESDISLPTSQSVNADLVRLGEVLINLLENAMNYSPKGGHIFVHATVEQSFLVVSVRDEGIGIPAKEKSMIFSKSFRAENAKRVRSTGNGLGLYLCKKFIEAHDGTLSFESEESKGSTFKFSIPLRKESVEAFFKRI